MVLESSREVASRGEDPRAAAQPRVRVRTAAAPAAPRAPPARRAPHPAGAPGVPAPAQRGHVQVTLLIRFILQQ